MVVAVITGLTGQDGGYLAEQLVARDHVVHGLVSPDQAHQELPAHLRALGDRLVIHEADVRDQPTLRSLIDAVEPDWLFNLAGISSVPQSWSDPIGTLDVNARPVVGMLEHLRRRQERGSRPTRFVQASSGEIFAGDGAHPIDERSKISPLNPYGASKAFAHQAVGMYRSRGLHCTSLVLFNHESPRRPEHFVTRKITAGVAAIVAGKANGMTLGNLMVRRDWGWAPDYTEAMLLAVAADEADDYVVATGEPRSLADLVTAAFGEVGIHDWDPFVTYDQSLVRPGEPDVLVGNPARLRERLGWAPTMGFHDMVAAMVAADLALLSREEEPPVTHS